MATELDIAKANRKEIIRIIGYLNELMVKTVKEIQKTLDEHEDKLSLLEPLLERTERERTTKFPLVFGSEDSNSSGAIEFFDSIV